MRLSGKLTVWDLQGGFGIITADESGEEIFVEAGALPPGPPLLLGEALAFDLALSPEGARRAVNISRFTHPAPGGAALSLAAVDTSLEARARLARPPVQRVARTPPARRIGMAWSVGRIVWTAVVAAGLAWLAVSQFDRLRTLRLKDLQPDRLLQAVPDVVPKVPPPAEPRVPLTQ